MARASMIPGFRFHPTDEELVMFYLKRKLLGKKLPVNAIAEVNIYDFSPRDLPDKSSLKNGDLEWYFFCPKTKKYSSGSRSNRSTETGFWKATGKDRKVEYNGRIVASIKTLVFHLGHAGKGQRTDWVMHEYKMEDEQLAKEGIAQDMYVACKVYEKSGSGPKNGAHYGKPFDDEEWNDDLAGYIGSQVIGASNTTDNAQKGAATVSITEPGSSIVTSADQPTKTHSKKKGPAATNMTEPISSVVTFSSAHTLNDKQKGPAALTMTEPGSFIVSSADQPTNTVNNKQKGPAALTMTESSSSIVMFSSDQPTSTQKGPAAMTMTGPGSSNQHTNTLNNKQKGPAATIMIEPGSSIVTFLSDQPTHTLNDLPADDDFMFFKDIDLPGDDVLMFSEDDVMFSDDIDPIMGSEVDEAAKVVKVNSTVPKEHDGIYDDLVDLMHLEELNKVDFKTDVAEYALNKLPLLDDLDVNLGEFYVD